MAEYEARLLTRAGAAGPIVQPRGISYNRGLGNTGKCSFTVSLEEEGLTDAALEPWATEVLLLRRADASSSWEVAFDGPLTDSEADLDGGSCLLTAGPVSEWLGRRWQRRSIGYARENTDLDQIANDMLYLAQHPEPPFAYSSRADFKVNGSSHPTGVLRTVRIAATDRVNWKEKLQELAAGNPSFDWDIETTWNASTSVRTRTFRTWNPGRGSAVATPLVLGDGLTGVRVVRRGSNAANYVEATGAGGTALVSDAQQDTSNQDTYGLVELFDSSSDINVKARLNDRAAEQLRLRKPPTMIVASATYDVTEGLPWRFATLGDTVPVRASRGPVEVDGTYRAVVEDVIVSEGGSERVTLTFQEPLS